MTGPDERAIPASTFEECWRQAAEQYAARTFLVFSDAAGKDHSWSYGEFDERVRRVAATLRATGLEPGRAVHVALRNSPAFLAVWLAAARLGARLVPVDPASTARDLAQQTRRTAPQVGIYSVHRADAYLQGADVPAMLPVTEGAEDLDEGSPLLGRPLRDTEGPPLTEPDTPMAVMFTSGTTSEPKGVILTQRNYATAAEHMAELSGLTAEDRWYVTLPLFHANAQYYCFAPAIRVGASVAMTAAFSASRWITTARRLRVTHASLFAAPIRMILARTPPGTRPLKLHHVWFAQSLSHAHHAAFEHLAGVAPRQLYGMTETVSVVAADLSPDPAPDRVGPPVHGRTIRLVTAGGRDAEGAEPGELWVRGTPGVDLFAGYHDPAANAGAFHQVGPDTWFSTGDLLSRTPDGVLRFVGRVDDVIKVAGENVSLTELEAVLAEAPGVLEAAAVAATDPVRDHVPVAYIVPRDRGRPPAIAELRAWAADRLVPAARPREWHIIDDLPRTSVGKVRRFRIPARTPEEGRD